MKTKKELLNQIANAYHHQTKYEDEILEVQRKYGIEPGSSATDTMLLAMDSAVSYIVDDVDKLDNLFEAIFDNGDYTEVIDEITKEPEFVTMEVDLDEDLINFCFNKGLRALTNSAHTGDLVVEEFHGYVTPETKTVEIPESVFEYITGIGVVEGIKGTINGS